MYLQTLSTLAVPPQDNIFDQHFTSTHRNSKLKLPRVSFPDIELSHTLNDLTFHIVTKNIGMNLYQKLENNTYIQKCMLRHMIYSNHFRNKIILCNDEAAHFVLKRINTQLLSIILIMI